MEIGKLTATTRGETIRFDLRPGRPLTLGRSSRCTVRVRDPKMSREHCRLEFVHGKLLVTDLASSHGLTYRGRTSAGFELEPGDGFHLGQTFVRFDGRETDVAEQRATVPVSEPPDDLVGVVVGVAAGGGDEPQELAAGAELGGFVIESVLGRSDRCTVYQASQVQLHRKVALKVLRRPSGGAHVPHERALFLEDVRTAASIADPLVVQVFDIGQVGADCFASMELVQGRCLAACIDHGRRLPWQELVPVLEDVLRALEVLHQLGLVHGAVKPANVFLLDKGSSKLADPRSTPRPRTAEEPGFSAPEQLGGQPVDARADLYALGCVAYAALAGRPPFLGSARHVAEAQERSSPASLLSFDPSIPLGLDQLIRGRLMAKDPAVRPRTAAQARAELLDSQARAGRSEEPTEPAAEYPTISVGSQAVARPASRRRRGSGGHGVVFQVLSQLILYVMILVAGAAVLLALKHKNPDWDIYRLLDWLRPKQ